MIFSHVLYRLSYLGTSRYCSGGFDAAHRAPNHGILYM
jgi:hypothetical protein